MDFEDFVACSYTPIKAIEVLSDIIYYKSNDDWNLYSQMTRQDGDELLAVNYAIKLCAKNLLHTRNKVLTEHNTK